MAVNYAEKYAPYVDEKLTKESITAPVINNNFDFVGVNAVNIYKGETAPLNDYVASGTNRFGNPNELGNEVETMVLTQDKGFTFSIDRKSYDDTMMTMEAGKSLQREIREVVVPYIDLYRLRKIAAADTEANSTSLTKTNAYELFLDTNMRLSDSNVPEIGRVAYVDSNYYTKLKLDPSFIKQSDLSQNIVLNGQVGMCDGVPIILAPKHRMPDGCDLIIAHNMACPAPVKLTEYRILDNVPGISGWLVEGRIRHDLFVLDNKLGCIATHIFTPQCEKVAFEPKTNTFSGSVQVKLSCWTEGCDIYYTDDGSVPTSSSTKYTAPFTLTATKTIKAIAIKSGYTNGEVTAKTFTKV